MTYIWTYEASRHLEVESAWVREIGVMFYFPGFIEDVDEEGEGEGEGEGGDARK